MTNKEDICNMGTQRRIQPVTDNKDKQRTYQDLMGKHSKAMRYEFYIEALMIDYAMLEDRLRSFLYYIGVFDSRESYQATKKKNVTRPLKSAMEKYITNEENTSLNVGTISGKMKIIRCTLKWYEELDGESQDKYLKALKKKYDGIDVAGLLDTLGKVNEWKDYRNEVMHAALNKNIDELYQDLASRAKEGMDFGRFVDSQVRELKKGKNSIRKTMGLGE